MTPRMLWEWAQKNNAEDLPMWRVGQEGDDERDTWHPLCIFCEEPYIEKLDMEWWGCNDEIYDETREMPIIAL